MCARLAVFSRVAWPLTTVQDWARSAGHEIALLVTQVNPRSTVDALYPSIVECGGLVMVVRDVAACEPVLKALDVDLGVIFAFSRVPDSVASLPRNGTVNVHPSLLPAYRGPNPLRSVYDGQPEIGATLHRITDELDGGPILARVPHAMPADPGPDGVLKVLNAAVVEAMSVGVPRALNGEAGESQEGLSWTPAPRFTAEEALLRLDLSAREFQCKVAALVLDGNQPYAELNAQVHPVRGVRRLPGISADKPGVVSQNPRSVLVAVTGGVLEVDIGRLPLQ